MDASLQHKGMILLLACLALGIWGLFVYRLTSELRAEEPATSDTPPAAVDDAAVPPAPAAMPFEHEGRSPFLPPWRASVVHPMGTNQPKPVDLPGAEKESPPAYTLRGIIGSTALIQEGTSSTPQLVRPRDRLGEAIVTRINAETVDLSWRGRHLTLHLQPSTP